MPTSRRLHRARRDVPTARGLGPVVSSQAGFTLIELLIVVIILGVLAGLVGPRLFGRVGQSRQAAARVQIELLGAALDQFKLDVGRYPTTQEGLQALQQSPGNAPGWEGPYLKKDVPRDPWGNAVPVPEPRRARRVRHRLTRLRRCAGRRGRGRRT